MNDAALLRRTEAGEEDAFQQLYDRYQPRLFRYALRMSGSQEVADEVIQEVFLGLIRGARGFDPALGPLGSYLYGMARNFVFRQLQAPVTEEIAEDSAVGDFDPLEGMAQAERAERVRAALASLPAHYREAVVLCDMEELSYSEVAEMLGVVVGTVRSRLHRARALLIEKLGQERIDQESCRA